MMRLNYPKPIGWQPALPRRETPLTPYPGKAFAAFGDETVDARGDDGQRYRAELEHGIGMVTTALPSKCGKGDTFKS